MPYIDFGFLIILILGIISLGSIILYLREYNLRQRFRKSNDLLFEQTQQKANTILHQAIKKAQAILGSAELEGIKILASSKLSSAKLDKKSQEVINQSIESSQQIIAKEVQVANNAISQSEQEFIQFLNQLKNQATSLQAQSQQITEARINKLFEQFEGRIASFLVKTESQTTQSVELELKSARQLIDTYKNQQMALIDENIVAMMEQTMSVVLGKKMSLKDQLDLVYEALEKAKIEKFIV
jgi:hypothetical protein